MLDDTLMGALDKSKQKNIFFRYIWIDICAPLTLASRVGFRSCLGI